MLYYNRTGCRKKELLSVIVLRETRILALITLLYLALAVTYSFVVPLWEAPDEPSHFLYARYLAQNGCLPSPTYYAEDIAGSFEKDYILSIYEWYHPPLYYLLGALALRAVEPQHKLSASYFFPPIDPDLAYQDSLFVHQSKGPFHFGEDELGPRLLRLLSILMGMGTIWVTYQTARQVFPSEPLLALAASGVVSFIPQYTFISASVNSDNLANLLSALALLLTVKWITKENSYGKTLRLGLFCSLALLSKTTTFFLVPVACLSFALRAKQKGSPRYFLKQSLAFLSLPLLATGLLLALYPRKNLWALAAAYTESSKVDADLISLGYLCTVLTQINQSFWARFGWMNILIPATIPNLLGLLCLASLISAVVFWVRGNRERILPPTQSNSLLALFALVLCALLALVKFNLAVFQPQGRFLFPAISAIAILTVVGLLSPLQPRYRPLATLVIVGGMLAFNLVCLTAYLWPIYHGGP
jgi:4-amino-4-deoxy-L-arabinose transferase-like glycosyltransferase